MTARERPREAAAPPELEPETAPDSPSTPPQSEPRASGQKHPFTRMPRRPTPMRPAPMPERPAPREDLPAEAPEVRATPTVAPPVLIGTLAGAGMPRTQPNLAFYGTDLGISFEHKGEHWMLFGDTWPSAEHICENERIENDDTLAILPGEHAGGVPPLRYLTTDATERELQYIRVMRGDESLPLGYGQAPLAGFSDGEHSFALFQRLEPHACDAPFATGSQACPTADGFECAATLGVCEPAALSFPAVCDAARNEGCLAGQRCVARTLCVDPTSSQNASGSFVDRERSVAQTLEIAVAREDEPAIYDSVLAWPTNKFSIPTARTVQEFTGTLQGNDYRPGTKKLLVWGRPGLSAEHERTAHLYLMVHDLPLARGDDGKLKFAPKYYAGVTARGEPIWSERQSEAKGVALDGRHDGDPREPVQLLMNSTISWLGEPINKWVMMYGGDLADYLLLDAAASRGARSPGAIWMRFADHPWGPFSAPTPHLAPGSPLRINDPYGPGGYLYTADCTRLGDAMCARSDPHRPLDTALEGCPIPFEDPGRLYAPNIIDRYTEPNAQGGLDIVWNVSTWNPYSVKLFRTAITPPGSGTRPLDELADPSALSRLSDWKSLPELTRVRRYEQQTSYDRGTEDFTFPLTNFGNRDFNNFVCKSDDATVADDQFAPFKYDLERCPESYVRGVVLSRFEGSGHMVRMWLGMQSLLFEPADTEVLRIYVDDDPRPRVDAPLAEVLDGRAGEIFAPPFGAGSVSRMSWYYPVSFRKKLIVAIDRLGELDNYFYHCDVVREEGAANAPVDRERLPEREAAFSQLAAVFQPAGTQPLLHEPLDVELGSGASTMLSLEGPATIHELQVQLREQNVSMLQAVRVRVHWDGADEPAIDVTLADLLGGTIPPEKSSHALTSVLEHDDRTLTLKLPMPFRERAQLAFANSGERTASFRVRVRGEKVLPQGDFGRLHVQRSETLGPTEDAQRMAVHAKGRGRLVGVCNELQGHADEDGGIMWDHLNLLEGDVRVKVDGRLTLNGTGSEEYADDVFYFVDAPHANAFVQAWGVLNDPERPPGRASFCRWHVLGTELDFEKSLELTYELGGAENPDVVERHKTVAYLYLKDEG